MSKYGQEKMWRQQSKIQKRIFFGIQEKNADSYILNLIINNTKIILYFKRSEGTELRLNDVLKFTYNEMLNDEYD